MDEHLNRDSTMSDLMSSLARLSPAEKLELIGVLWDDLSALPANVPLQDWQIAELDRRSAHLEANPDSTVTWDELVQRVRARYGR
jgi:putative addiction module component (TIGR02574 family)